MIHGRIAFFQFCSLLLFILLSTGNSSFSQSENFEFFKGAIYRDDIQSPGEYLRYDYATRPIGYQEAVQYITYLGNQTDRAYLQVMGKTFEGRELHYIVISSEKNLQEIDHIRSNIKTLADPRLKSSQSEIRHIIQTSPAIAWMLYSIHGDELSGVDAAIQLAYQLTAGEDSLSQLIRDKLIVCIHPMENPDGRARFLGQMEQWAGLLAVDDIQSIQHTGVWPWGRGNHYLFDLNRDWFLLINPESQARVSAIIDWQPQLIVDAHEMGSLDTYLFSPAREPINPHIPDALLKWGDTFAKDQASTLDEYGWSYYTREWLEDWYPGYGSSWPFLVGAVGILYEQASTDGSLVKRRDGTVLTFREAVHHQFVSSVANLRTAARNREALLDQFYQLRKAAAAEPVASDPQVFYFVPGQNKSRARTFIQKLIMQGIEVKIARENFEAKNLQSYLQGKISRKKLPQGTYIIQLSQPLRPLIQSILEFDPRMTTQFLEEERKSLLNEKETKLYEVTSWSLPMAYNLESYWSQTMTKVSTEPYQESESAAKNSIDKQPLYGLVIDNSDDASHSALTQYLQKGFHIRAAKKSFTINGKTYNRGSLLIRLHENPDKSISEIISIADQSGIHLSRINTALAESGPDLGGNDFVLLTQPRIALATGPGVSLTSFSSLWYLLDRHLQIKHSILQFDQLERIDLSKYNVLIFPSTWGGIKIYQNNLNKSTISKLKSWIEAGGTLIGIENGAAFIADSSSGICNTRLRRQALQDLPLYQEMGNLKNAYNLVGVDSINIWEQGKLSVDSFRVAAISKEQLKLIKKQDELERLFHPIGAILRSTLDEDHWITFGMGSEVPVIVNTAYVLLALDPVQTPARFNDSSKLRLSGLLWPEAQKRIGNSEYLTVEKIGRGQVILFAGDPYFRAYFQGSAKLLINSLLYGPGMGTVTSVPW